MAKRLPGTMLAALLLAGCGPADSGPNYMLTAGHRPYGTSADFVQRTAVVDLSRVGATELSLGEVHCPTDSCHVIVETIVEPSSPAMSRNTGGSLRWCLLNRCGPVAVDSLGFANDISNRGPIAYGDHRLDILLRVNAPGPAVQLRVTWNVSVESILDESRGGPESGVQDDYGADYGTSWPDAPSAEESIPCGPYHHRDECGQCREDGTDWHDDPLRTEDGDCPFAFQFNECGWCVPVPIVTEDGIDYDAWADSQAWWAQLAEELDLPAPESVPIGQTCVLSGHPCERSRRCTQLSCWCKHATADYQFLGDVLSECIAGFCPDAEDCAAVCDNIGGAQLDALSADCRN